MDDNKRLHSEKEVNSKKNAQPLTNRRDKTILTDVERKDKELKKSTIGGF